VPVSAYLLHKVIAVNLCLIVWNIEGTLHAFITPLWSDGCVHPYTHTQKENGHMLRNKWYMYGG
jgi:hypothetical protein